MNWLLRGLLESRATWKVIAADMPIGLMVPDGKDAEGRDMFEAVANGDGPALGREIGSPTCCRPSGAPASAMWSG